MELPSTQSPKSFWQRPEGKTGMFFLLVIAAGLVFAGVHLLPFILLALQNTIMTVVLGVALFGLIFVLMDPKFRAMIGGLYQIAMRGLTSTVIELDPIAIAEGYLEKLQGSIDKMSEQLDLLRGQADDLFKKIKKNEDTIQKSMGIASNAKIKMSKMDASTAEYAEMRGVAALKTNEAAKLQESNKKLNEVLGKITGLSKTLEKMHGAARFVLADKKTELAIAKEERKSVATGYSAFKSALKVLNGNGAEAQMYDESMEFMALDLSNKLGEIERFMENSGSFLTSVDLENDMYAEKGLKMLEAWENEANGLSLLDAPKSTVTPVVLPSVSDSIGKAKTSRYLE